MSPHRKKVRSTDRSRFQNDLASRSREKKTQMANGRGKTGNTLPQRWMKIVLICQNKSAPCHIKPNAAMKCGENNYFYGANASGLTAH